MKKMIALILCVLLVAALGITAFAADTAKITVTPSASTVYPGDEVTVTVSVASEKMWSSIGYFPWYDSAAFTVVSGETLDPFIFRMGDSVLSEFDTVKNGGFTMNPGSASSGDVFRFVIKIKDDAPVGEYDISDEADMNIDCELVDAKIKVACKHEYGKWTEAGDEHTKTCSKCGDVQKGDHAWDAGKVTTEPTCKDKGVKTFTCADCGATKTEDVAKTNNHTYGKWTAAGDEHTKTCSVCGDVQKAAHAWDAGKVTTEPTCTAKGVKTFTCTDCKATKTADVDMIDHAWDEGKVTTEPTCTAEGEKTYTCTACKTETKTEKIEMVDHKADKWEKVDEKTHKGTCSVCKQEVTVEHVYEEKVTKEATCKEEGEKTLTCSCGEVVTEKIAKLTEHKWDEGKVTTAATAEKEGVKTYTCSVCGETKTEAVAKLPASSNTDTGDNTMMIPLMILVVLSGFGLALTVIGKKKFAR